MNKSESVLENAMHIIIRDFEKKKKKKLLINPCQMTKLIDNLQELNNISYKWILKFQRITEGK